MPKLSVDHATFFNDTDSLLDLLSSISALQPRHQKLIAEIVLVRLALALENTLKSIFCKLACNANYIDLSHPKLLVKCRSAVHKMETLKRSRRRSLRWNEGIEIRKNVKHVVDKLDHSVTIIGTVGSLMTEIRHVRNRIVHKNANATKNFSNVVRKYYGAYQRQITCGTLLLSPRVSKPTLVEVYIRQTRVLVKDLVKA